MADNDLITIIHQDVRYLREKIDKMDDKFVTKESFKWVAGVGTAIAASFTWVLDHLLANKG